MPFISRAGPAVCIPLLVCGVAARHIVPSCVVGIGIIRGTSPPPLWCREVTLLGMGIAGGVVYAHLGVTVVFGHSPQTARCPSHNRVGAYRASEAVGVPVCGGCRLLPVPPLGWEVFWCQGGLPACPLLWVAVNTAVAAHLCKGILASVNAGICGPCMHLQDINFRSALL